MSKKKIDHSVRQKAAELMEEKGYISPVELLVKMDRLTSKQVKDWRFKRIPYLERVTLGGLGKLNHILNSLKKFAEEQNLKPSMTVYKSWGRGPKTLLRFSKSGNVYMEERYSTHYVKNREDK